MSNIVFEKDSSEKVRRYGTVDPIEDSSIKTFPISQICRFQILICTEFCGVSWRYDVIGKVVNPTKNFEEGGLRVIHAGSVQGNRNKGFDICDGKCRVVFWSVGY